MSDYITFILPTHNEEKNIISLIKEILFFENKYEIEIIVVDDNSHDRTQILVRELSKSVRKVRLINRVGRFGLSSAICEGCLNANGEIIAVMDSDGQHEVKSVYQSIDYLLSSNKDLIVGSRFAKGSSIEGLSKKREQGSSFANHFARFTLSRNYGHLSDFMSGCFAFKRNSCINYLKKLMLVDSSFYMNYYHLVKGH